MLDTCLLCGMYGRVERHHIWDKSESNLTVALCRSCHKEHHTMLREVMYDFKPYTELCPYNLYYWPFILLWRFAYVNARSSTLVR